MSDIQYQATSLSRVVLGFKSDKEANAFLDRVKHERDVLWGTSINPSSSYDKPWVSGDGKLLNFDYDPTKNSFVPELGNLSDDHVKAAVENLCIWAKSELGFILKDADDGSIFFAD